MKLRNVIIVVLFIFIIIVVYLLFFRETAKEKSGKTENPFGKLVSQLEGQIIKPSKLVQEIEVSGTILPFEETVLMAEIPGRVVKMFLNEGKAVARGTLLIKLFDEDLQAQLKMLEVQKKIAENNEQRMKTLLNVQGTSQQEYDASLLQVSNLKAQIDILKVNIGKTEIRAPYNGIVGLKKISVGQYVTPNTQIVTIRASNSLKLDFSIPERYGTSISPGKSVEFTVAGSDNIYKATVMATEASIEPDSRNLNVRSIVKGNISRLIPGSFAKVKANMGSKENAIMIPTSAIVPQASEKKVYISDNGKASFVTIQTGIREANAIEVLSGLKPGDTLVTTGIMFIKPNSKLKFSKVR